jgi:hypothetical protein
MSRFHHWRYRRATYAACPGLAIWACVTAAVTGTGYVTLGLSTLAVAALSRINYPWQRLFVSNKHSALCSRSRVQIRSLITGSVSAVCWSIETKNLCGAIPQTATPYLGGDFLPPRPSFEDHALPFSPPKSILIVGSGISRLGLQHGLSQRGQNLARRLSLWLTEA